MVKYKNKQCHELMVLARHFGPLNSKLRTFDIRLNDRDFKVGDYLWMREYDSVDGDGYTGRDFIKEVTYIQRLDDFIGIDEEYVVMSIVNPWPIESDEIEALFAGAKQ